jgi:hypothetical protein
MLTPPTRDASKRVLDSKGKEKDKDKDKMKKGIDLQRKCAGVKQLFFFLSFFVSPSFSFFLFLSLSFFFDMFEFSDV